MGHVPRMEGDKRPFRHSVSHSELAAVMANSLLWVTQLENNEAVLITITMVSGWPSLSVCSDLGADSSGPWHRELSALSHGHLQPRQWHLSYSVNLLFERHFGNELREFTWARGPAQPASSGHEVGTWNASRGSSERSWGAGLWPYESCGQRKPTEEEERHSSLSRLPWRVDISKMQNLWCEELNRTHW